MSDGTEPITQSSAAIKDLFSTMQWIHVYYPLDMVYSESDNLEIKLGEIPIRLLGNQIVDSNNDNPISSLQSIPLKDEIYPNIPHWMNNVITLRGVTLATSDIIPKQVTELKQLCIRNQFIKP